MFGPDGPLRGGDPLSVREPRVVEMMDAGASDKAAQGSSEKQAQSRKRKAIELLQHRQALPIWSARKKLVELVQENDSVVLVGETGSGKTTQAPQLVYLRSKPPGCIACTQPRRVAAITVAQRVAAEMGVGVGELVGYSVRFDDSTSKNTKIKYLTDGMLIREAILDPSLYRYSVIFVDEAHERTVNTDVLLGLLKGAQLRRKQSKHPLKLVVMSATLDQANFTRYFDGSVPAYVEGRQYPVDIFYTAQAQDSYVQAAINTILQVHFDEGDGSVLVFLTGQDEIDNIASVLEEQSAHAKHLKHPRGLGLHVVSIYAAMPPEQQLLAFAAPLEGRRKVILSTNIAETSVTIPGVRFVIDTGMVKARAYSAAKGLDSLQVVPTSKAQARQRSGRAGREAPGKCFRLYPESAFAALPDTTIPEIQRTNLVSAVLQLKAMGIHDILNFDFMDPPPRATLVKSLELLYALEAIDGQGALTDLGRRMAALPIDPQHAAVLLAGIKLSCLQDAMAVVSMMSADRILVVPRGREQEARAKHAHFRNLYGDHLTLLNIFNQYRAVGSGKRGDWCRQHFVNSKSMRNATNIFDQLAGHMLQFGATETDACLDDYTAVRQALVCGLFLNAARLQPDGSYKVIASGQAAAIHPSSTLLSRKPECILFNEVIMTNRPYAHVVTAVEPVWLTQLVPRFFVSKSAGPPAAGQAWSHRPGQRLV